MESFAEVINLFGTFDLQLMFNSVMKELSNEIIELNQIKQLADGYDANGLKIKTLKAEQQGNKAYSSFTIGQRKAKGLQTSNVDLKDTGVFWKSFSVIKVNSGWQVQADFNIHGEDIMGNFDSKYDFTGLTQNNLEVLVYDSIIPKLTILIRKHFKI